MQELDFLKEYLFCRSPNLKDYLCEQLLYFIIDDDDIDIDSISRQTKILLGKVFFCPSVTVQFPLEERETSCGKVAFDAEALLAALIREAVELTIEECQILTISLLERLLETELDEELTLKIKSLVQS